eukprot:10076306-Karenia_brevis.AAC.1
MRPDSPMHILEGGLKGTKTQRKENLKAEVGVGHSREVQLPATLPSVFPDRPPGVFHHPRRREVEAGQ